MRRSLVAVALVALAALPARPLAAAAASGYHATYFSESAFLALAPGQTGQLSVGFQNSGDQPWTKAVALAALHTAAPLDNGADAVAGWASGWPSATVYAIQAAEVVAPGAIAYFTYTVTVPATASGAHSFYGRLVVSGVGPLEDWGYYHVVTVTKATTTVPAPPTSAGGGEGNMGGGGTGGGTGGYPPPGYGN